MILAAIGSPDGGTPPLPTMKIAMVATYWVLTTLCLVCLAVVVTFRFSSRWAQPSMLRKKRRLQTRVYFAAFVVISWTWFLDSLYWSIANTSKAGILPGYFGDFLYADVGIVVIKSIFAAAIAIFIATYVSVVRRMEQEIDAGYFINFADNISDGVGILDQKGKIIYWNKGAEHLLGWSRRFALGKHISLIIPERLQEKMRDLLDGIQEKQRPIRIVTYRRTSTNQEVPLDISITPFADDSTKARGYFGVMRPFYSGERQNIDLFSVPESAISGKFKDAAIATERAAKPESSSGIPPAFKLSLSISAMAMSCILIIVSRAAQWDEYRSALVSASVLFLIVSFSIVCALVAQILKKRIADNAPLSQDDIKAAPALEDVNVAKQHKDEEGGQESELRGAELMMNLAITAMIMGLAIFGFVVIPSSIGKILFFLFTVVSLPIILGFTKTSGALSEEGMLQLYRTGVEQLPVVGDFLARLFWPEKDDPGGEPEGKDAVDSKDDQETEPNPPHQQM